MRRRQGVAYSTHGADSNIVLLAPAWGAFISAGVVAMYHLGHALWSTKSDGTTPNPSEAKADGKGGQPDASVTEADTCRSP